MIWTDTTHDFACTSCRATGKTCPAMIGLLENLTRAIRAADAVTEPDFELRGTARIDGCAKGCAGRFIARHDRIDLFCDAAEGMGDARLVDLADRFLGQGLAPVAPGTAMPGAMARAQRKAPVPA